MKNKKIALIIALGIITIQAKEIKAKSYDLKKIKMTQIEKSSLGEFDIYISGDYLYVDSIQSLTAVLKKKRAENIEKIINKIKSIINTKSSGSIYIENSGEISYHPSCDNCKHPSLGGGLNIDKTNYGTK